MAMPSSPTKVELYSESLLLWMFEGVSTTRGLMRMLRHPQADTLLEAMVLSVIDDQTEDKAMASWPMNEGRCKIRIYRSATRRSEGVP
jgi:hypothetical protein